MEDTRKADASKIDTSSSFSDVASAEPLPINFILPDKNVFLKSGHAS